LQSDLLTAGAAGRKPSSTESKDTDLECTVHPKSVDDVIRAGREALQRVLTGKHWDDWLLVGEALQAGRVEAMRSAHANKPEGRRYNEEYGHWLKTNKFDVIEATTRKRLLTCLEHRNEIEAWRKTLTANKLHELNHPGVVLRRWLKTQVKKPDAKPKPSHVAKLNATIYELEEQNHRLRQNAPFTPQDKPKDIAAYIWRTIHEAPKLARSIARALDQIAKEAEKKKPFKADDPLNEVAADIAQMLTLEGES
jgi:hypothetical protein